MALPQTEPTYERLAREIEAELRDGFWRDGDPLPSEAAFAASYGVSRKTIRRAFEIIERGGLIDRSQGRNSLVRNPRIEKAIGLASDFSSEARRAGLRPRSRLESIRIRDATLGESVHLGLPTGTEVVEIVRTRQVEGLPTVWQTSVLPAAIARELDGLRQAGSSLYGAIRNKLGIEISGTEDRLSIIVACAREAERLRVANGTTLVRMTRLASAKDGRAIEFSISLIRPEFFVFQTSRWIEPHS